MDRYPLLLFVLIGYLLVALCPSSFARSDSLWQAFNRIVQTEQEPHTKVDSLNAFANRVLEIDANLVDRALVLAQGLAHQHAYIHGEAVSLYLIAHNKEAHGSIKEAETAILAAISLFEKEKPQPVSIRAYLHAGWLYRRLRERGKAVEYGMRALKLAEQTRDTVNIGNGYNQLAILYVDIEDYEKALEYHRHALHWRRFSGNAVSIALSLGNIGIVNMRLGHYNAALAAHKQGVQTVIQAGDRSEEAFFYNDIGSTYLYKGDTDSAIHYLKKSIAMREVLQETNEIAYTYNYLGEAYEKAGDIRGGEQWIKKALQTAIDIDNTKQHQEALESLSDFYARNQLYDSAYAYLHKHKVYSDSIAQSDREKLIDELAAQYETEKKEQQIEILSQQTALQKLRLRQRGIVLIAAIVLLSVLAGFIYFVQNKRKLQTKARLQKRLSEQQQQAARDVLQAEERERRRIATDLHDGVGQLMSAALLSLHEVTDDASIPALVRPQLERATALVGEGYDEMRSISHQMMPNALLKAGLASSIKEFLEKIEGKQLKIQLDVVGLDERLDEQTETVLYRVIQETVTNVIKHAQASKLSIQLVRDSDGIDATIEDNGIGFKATRIAEGEGIGLKNIFSRIALLNGTVEVDTAPGRGTLMVIHIPT